MVSSTTVELAAELLADASANDEIVVSQAENVGTAVDLELTFGWFPFKTSRIDCGKPLATSLRNTLTAVFNSGLDPRSVEH